MEDTGRYLFLIAFVVIAAIQWVIQQFQKRNAPPQQEEDPLEDTWKELEEHHGRQLREQQRLHQPQLPPQPQTRPEPKANPVHDLRSLFESLRQPEQPQQPQRPVVRIEVEQPRRAAAKVPQPVDRRTQPKKAKQPVDPRSQLSAVEMAALQNVSAQGGIASRRRSSKRKGPHGGFRELLHGAGNLRRALILKEVFDKPLALREQENNTVRG